MPEGKETYVPSSSLVRAQCQSIVDASLGEQLHSGKSDIFEACTNGHCPYIVKFKLLFTQDELAQFLQEMFFAQYVNTQYAALQNEFDFKLESVTPIVHDSWVCVQANGTLGGYMVMDRKSMNLYDYIHSGAKFLSTDHIEAIAIKLEHLFQVLILLGVWHRNVTLNNIVVQGDFPELDLFIIDWDDIVWSPNDQETTAKRYAHLLQSLVGRMKREQMRALHLNVQFKGTILDSPLFNPAQSFRPIVEEDTKESAEVVARFTPPTPIPIPLTSSSFPSTQFAFSSAKTPNIFASHK